MATNVVTNAIVLEVLRDGNYANWRVCLKNYLLAHDLWEVIESNDEPPDQERKEAEFRVWRKKNAQGLHAIQMSCAPYVLSQIRDIGSAKLTWDTLAKIMNEQLPLSARGDGSQPTDDQDDELQGNHLEDEVQGANEPLLKRKDVNPGRVDNVYVQYRPLYKAIARGARGDRAAVKNFLKIRPDGINASLTEHGWTALHFASYVGNLKIVLDLVELMTQEDMEIINDNNDTALCLAACGGVTRIAQVLINKNKKLTCMANEKDDIPVTVACNFGHKDMARYLYSVTPFELLLPDNGTYGTMFLHSAIYTKMLDIALDLLQRCPRLAFTKSRLGTTPLEEICLLSHLFPSGCRFDYFWERLCYRCIYVQPPPASRDFNTYNRRSGIRDESILVQVFGQLRNCSSNVLERFGIMQIYELKMIHCLALECIRCMSEQLSCIDDMELSDCGVYSALFRAVKSGIVEIVIAMIKANPHLLTCLDEKERSIMQLAVIHRQEKIFNLAYGLGTRKEILIAGYDDVGNNILHMAAMLAPSPRLARISGAALQMQRELQWFKEVKSIANPTYETYANDKDELPNELFSKAHKDLMRSGEKWMKQTASSYTVVGALIITIMFAALLTLPGGNDQVTGYPIFRDKKSFTVFIISDAVSLFASSTSVLMFLGILTSRYAEQDFLISLPTKLIIGLSMLFFSIAAMMVTFCAALILILEGRYWVIVPLILLASVPVTLFIWLQFPLLVEIFISTYGSGNFDRKTKCTF